MMGFMALLPPHPWPVRFPPLGLILVYGVIANICYGLGWLTETAMVRLWGEEAPLAGPVHVAAGGDLLGDADVAAHSAGGGGLGDTGGEVPDRLM